MDIFEDAIVPETPKALPNEQLFVYVPIGTIDNPGIVTFDGVDFRIDEHGRVYMKASSTKNAKDIRDIFALLYGYREGEPAEGQKPGAVLASVRAVMGKMQTVEEQLEGIPKDAKAVKNALDSLKISITTALSAVETKLANFLDVDDHTRDQLSEVLGLISANADAIETFKNMGGAPVGSGTLVVPASEWSDGSPTTAFVNLPANTLHAGSVMLLTPANDTTKETASKAGLSVSVDASGDYGDEVNDVLLLLRAETAAKPAIDMEFAYVILQTTATTSLVTLIGVDATGSSDGGDKAAGYLVSTGDTTDRLAEIQALLDNNGYVKLGKGEFYLSGQLRVRNGATLDGCGKATVIKQTPDSTQSSMIWLQSEGTIRNVCLQGEWTAKPTNETAYTSRRIGIVITGGTNNAIIDGCWFIGWTGQAILATTNSTATRSFLMSNCDVRWNNVGLKTAESEYACITNCTFRENITGVLNNGGNNKFVCCGFDSNYDGFVINDGYNNGHGSCNGCTFNHNTHYAVNMAYTEFGFVFSGCNFAEGTIRNTKSKGIMFSGCRFGNWMKYNNYTTNPTLFSGCIFSHSPQTESSEWLDTYGGYKFTGCYNYNTGESVDNIPVAAPETWSFTLEDGSTITKDVMLDV